MVIRLSTGETFDIQRDESILQAFKRQGIYLVASCGGKGICGKCRVSVTGGEFTSKSRSKLTPHEISSGMALACQTFPLEDIDIDIPKESRLVIGDEIEISRSQDLPGLFRLLDGTISPLVSRVDLKLVPPTLDNNLGDLERLKRALEEKGVEELRFSRTFVESLPGSLRDAGWNISLSYTEALDAVFLRPLNDNPRYGIAIDVGTTTIVVYLLTLADGSVLDVGSTYNSQIRYGDDVITRIVHATEGGGMKELREAVVNDINNLLSPMLERQRCAPDDIESAVISGNTTMTHLFWGLDPSYIREEPYTPVINSVPLWNACDSGITIHPSSPVYTVPSVASYIGGDIVSGVLASKMHRSNDISLFMDIGTNGEIVIGNNEWLVTAACSAGPCFEGSGITHGMRATRGAVEGVRIHPDTFDTEVDVIGNVSPLGICGSGMIDAITEMFLTGLIDQKGQFQKSAPSGRIREGIDGLHFVVCADGYREVVLSEVDIENIIRAKAAIYAGISLLLKEVGVTFHDVTRIYIAGGFGNYLNIEKAIVIGMLPDLPREKFRFIGNSSIAGAYLCLLSKNMRQEAEEIARKMTHIELSVSRGFMDEYLSALFLPHTDISLFPTVASLHSGKKG